MFKKPIFDDTWINTEKSINDKLAEELEWNLTKNADFPIPDIDWEQFEIPDDLFEIINKTPHRLTIEEVTTKIPRGTGAFDVLMESCRNHIKEEFDANRITGAEYTKAYIACMNLAMQSAITFLTSQDQLLWQNVSAQLAAFNTMVQLLTAKMNLAIARLNVYSARAQYASGKLSLATTREQSNKIREDYEATRAQTLDTRTSNEKITGAIGKQKELYDQQIKSYKISGMTDIVKLKSDLLAVAKTNDEGLLLPDAFQNKAIDDNLDILEKESGLN